MAKCAICEKAAHFGNAVSHSHRRSNKMWKANVKSVKVKTVGGAKKMYVCTSCLKSGLVAVSYTQPTIRHAMKKISVVSVTGIKRMATIPQLKENSISP